MTAPEQRAVAATIFVYGTLKRGHGNHPFLAGQRFVSAGRTPPGFVLYQLDGYPGMVRDDAEREGVTGEVWEVDGPCLAALDELEGVSEGLYRREAIQLAEPAGQPVQTYVYARPVAGRRRLGATWPA